MDELLKIASGGNGFLIGALVVLYAIKVFSDIFLNQKGQKPGEPCTLHNTIVADHASLRKDVDENKDKIQNLHIKSTKLELRQKITDNRFQSLMKELEKHDTVIESIPVINNQLESIFKALDEIKAELAKQ